MNNKIIVRGDDLAKIIGLGLLLSLLVFLRVHFLFKGIIILIVIRYSIIHFYYLVFKEKKIEKRYIFLKKETFSYDQIKVCEFNNSGLKY